MSAKHVHYALIAAIVIVLLGIVGATHSFSKLFTAQSVELAASRGISDQLSTQQVGLIKAKRDLEQYADLARITNTIVPQDKDQAQTVRELVGIADDNNVTLNNINFPSSSLGGRSSTAKFSQLQKVRDISGVYNLQITVSNNVNSAVSYDQLLGFLEDLENNRRTAAVSSVSIQPQGGDANSIVFTLVINTYVKPA